MRTGIALLLMIVPAMAFGSHGGYRNLARQYWSQELEPDDEDSENKSQILDDTDIAFQTYLALVVVILLLMAWLAARS